MKKQRRRQRAQRPRKRGSQKSQGGPASARHLALAYLKSKPETSAKYAKALRAALPRDVPLYSSNWLAAGRARAQKASGLNAFEALDLLGDFVRWCHHLGHVPPPDGAILLAQLELLRRRAGAPPGTVTLPEAQSPGQPTATELRHVVAYWEAMSSCAALSEEDDDRTLFAMVAAGAFEVARHLAEADGVPMRLDRLEPAAFALSVDTEPPPEVAADLPPRPEHYAPLVLEAASLFYERCAQRGYVDAAVAADRCAQLSSLAMAYHQRERAA